MEQDIAFLGPYRQEKLDLYLPAGRAKTIKLPGIVIIHGGGFSGGDKATGREFNIGTTLAKAGYVCVSVEYMKEAGKRWPTNLQDCKNGVRFLRKNADKYQVDVDHIGVIGGSAGGHLALMVAFTPGLKELEPAGPYPGISDRVQACVDLYGPTNLATRKPTDKEGNPVPGKARETSALFSEQQNQKPENWKLASPVTHVSEKCPPTLIIHGLADTTVDRDQSKELDQKLTEAKVEHRLILLPGVGHTFDLQTWGKKPLPQDLRPIVVEFFDKHLKPTAK